MLDDSERAVLMMLQEPAGKSSQDFNRWITSDTQSCVSITKYIVNARCGIFSSSQCMVNRLGIFLRLSKPPTGHASEHFRRGFEQLIPGPLCTTLRHLGLSTAAASAFQPCVCMFTVPSLALPADHAYHTPDSPDFGTI
ncbi:uncharacterized protein PV06_00146 [Exophiala oligosperma]|uniref:Uncharacterized protein n=1 Tax=Exophiala oligosperma TaxID=215243 RepID=A0A0D2B5D7_9EURO|nr:uncharacterized protein PV06_00146 [Exophiala oligosperma]KIW47451.1 hypothetical protein PV06_00146 [Exophiala oligosperma]